MRSSIRLDRLRIPAVSGRSRTQADAGSVVGERRAVEERRRRSGSAAGWFMRREALPIRLLVQDGDGRELPWRLLQQLPATIFFIGDRFAVPVRIGGRTSLHSCGAIHRPQPGRWQPNPSIHGLGAQPACSRGHTTLHLAAPSRLNRPHRQMHGWTGRDGWSVVGASNPARVQGLSSQDCAGPRRRHRFHCRKPKHRDQRDRDSATKAPKFPPVSPSFANAKATRTYPADFAAKSVV